MRRVLAAGPRYAPITVEHFQHPRNVGRIADADGVGRVDDAARETTISLYVKLDAAGRVVRATFRTFGCSACIAASSMATELLVGRATVESDTGAVLSAIELDAALGGLPEEKRYCAALVAEAARRAVGNIV